MTKCATKCVLMHISLESAGGRATANRMCIKMCAGALVVVGIGWVQNHGRQNVRPNVRWCTFSRNRLGPEPRQIECATECALVHFLSESAGAIATAYNMITTCATKCVMVHSLSEPDGARANTTCDDICADALFVAIGWGQSYG